MLKRLKRKNRMCFKAAKGFGDYGSTNLVRYTLQHSTND
jgi:hypothetical protein